MLKYATRQRAALLQYLEDHIDESLSAVQITEALAQSGISKSAVYRNLAALEAEGLIDRSAKSGTKTIFYRYHGSELCREHIHMSCRKCGRTYHMDAGATNRLLDSVEEASNFQIDKASTVLYGVCADCRERGSHE